MADFVRGTFQAYEVVTRVHLGALAQDITPGDIIEFDGQTARFGGSDHAIPALRSAIAKGWLVPDGTSTGDYRPQAATSISGRKMDVQTVQDDNREVGKIKLSATANPPPKVDTAARAASDKTQSQGTSGSEGVSIGRIKTSASQKTIITAENSSTVAAAINRMDNTQGNSGRLVEPTVAPRTAYTGDVDVATSGDNLEDLLPNAVSSQKPAPGIAGEGTTAPLSTAEEKAQALRESRRRDAQAAELKSAAVVIESTDDFSDLEGLDLGFENLPAPAAKPAVDPEAAKLAMIRMSIPDFAWDTSKQWRNRVKEAVDTYGDNPLYMNGILALETDTVRKFIGEALQARSAPRG